MHSHSDSIKIVLKIWIAALLMNTLLGTAILTDLYTYADMIGLIALLGFLYGAAFSLPFFIILFFSLRLYVRMEISGKKLFSYFFLTGLMLATGCVTIFFLMAGTLGFPMWSLLSVALCSGAVAMLLEYKPVLQLRKDAEESRYDRFLE